MKIFLSFLAGLVFGAASLHFMHRQVRTDEIAAARDHGTSNLPGKKALHAAGTLKGDEVSDRPVNLSSSGSNSMRADARIPSRATADWTREERDVDRRFGIVYRICSLLPGERELVRRILTRESLLAASRNKMISAGIRAEDADLMLQSDQLQVQKDTQQLENTAPEVSAFLALCKSHPDALADTSAIAERILNETGSVDPDVADLIFSASVKAASSDPMPAYVNNLDFNGRSAVELNTVEEGLFRRNSKLIPAISSKLAPNQMTAVISYYEEQLNAIMKQKEINAHHN